MAGWGLLVVAWSLPNYVLLWAWWHLPPDPRWLRVVVSPTLVLPITWGALLVIVWRRRSLALANTVAPVV